MTTITKNCISCGYTLPQFAKFCSDCGVLQSTSVALAYTEGYNSNEGETNASTNTSVVVEKQMPLLPADDHECEYRDCTTASTAKCQDCQKWSCKVHLNIVHKYNNDTITVCPGM